MKTKSISFKAVILAIILVLLTPTFALAAETQASGKASPVYKGKNASHIPILTYHRIVTAKEKKSPKYRDDPWTMSESAFKKQMAWLHKKGYRTINCDEFYKWYKGKIKLPKRTVLITIDDGHAASIKRARKVWRKYDMKATAFIIGRRAVKKKGRGALISKKRILKYQKSYPNLEFQSHTYNLHIREAQWYSYKAILKDAKLQKKAFGFKYMAYPYGRISNNMIKAYKKAGIKMAFAFDGCYATRNQNKYMIGRLAIIDSTSMKQFKEWCP